MFDYIDLKKAVRRERAANEKMRAELLQAQEQIEELTEAAIELAGIIAQEEDDG